ncbi:hypothetical protein LXL04_017681 [Taraxacum kok-saghyz]
MSFRGGRDRHWKDYPLRPEEKSHHGRSTAPPSRHLWVGNLSHTLTERALSNHFRQFGELESVGFSPGRSYAFVNFIEVSAAFAAIGALQGFILAGNALRIEFTKAEKSPSRDEDDKYLHRRIRHSNSGSDPNYQNQKPSTKEDEEPNEVLWIGFPQSLKVDEHSFYTAFSPFGEIEKVSSYPGRTYAFVRYKHINSAIRAKDNLQGKLFGNPRVHITFARSESRALNPDPISPRYHDRSYHDEQRKPSSGRNHGFRDTGYGYGRRSPSRDRNVNFHDFPPPPRQPPLYDDEWDLPEDALIFHNAKKLKGGLIPIPELPEYPFSEHVKNALMRPPGFDNNLGHFGYHNNNQMMIPVERGNNTRNGPYDGFQGGPVPLAQNATEWKRPTPEPHIPASDEWKWEGIIAKGGTSICRARCFPVGKVLDMILPEFLDCTARTSLDMLAKHYYQAASSWVVFFVPESDADMAFYNEFMNYLGEKQRAAVAKLDDKTTLFLVPPSDLSEKILKVPGKLSISGVILRLEQPPATTLPPPPPPPPYSGHFQNHGKPRPVPYHVENTNTPDHLPPTSVMIQDTTGVTSYRPGTPTIMPQYQEPKPVGVGIQQDQLAQLASFLGREEFRQPTGLDNGYRTTPHQYHHQQLPSPSQQYHQVGQSSSQGNVQEETEADPQKRLQATLDRPYIQTKTGLLAHARPVDFPQIVLIITHPSPATAHRQLSHTPKPYTASFSFPDAGRQSFAK